MGRPQGTKKLVSDKISQLEGNRTSTQSQSPDSLPTVDFASSQDCSIKVCVCVCMRAHAWVCVSVCVLVPPGLRSPCVHAWCFQGSLLDSEARVCVCVCVCLSVCLSLSKEDFWSPWTQRLLHACVSVCMCV